MKYGYLLVDHGSRRSTANEQLEAVAADIRQLEPDTPVVCAHLEIAKPSISDGCAELIAAGIEEIRVLVYFLSNGRHASEDIPREVEEACAQSKTPFVIGKPLGPHLDLARLLIKRCN